MSQQQGLSLQELPAFTSVETRLAKPSRLGDGDPVCHLLPFHTAALSAAAAGMQEASHMLPHCRPQ